MQIFQPVPFVLSYSVAGLAPDYPRCSLTGQSRSRPPEDAPGQRQTPGQSSCKPTDPAFAGDRKAVALSATRSRTAMMTGRSADLSSFAERLYVFAIFRFIPSLQ
jgi:hypothetical protein